MSPLKTEVRNNNRRVDEWENHERSDTETLFRGGVGKERHFIGWYPGEIIKASSSGFRQGQRNFLSLISCLMLKMHNLEIQFRGLYSRGFNSDKFKSGGLHKERAVAA
jgi:hypothetical protein